MALKVNITWGREKFKDVALDTTASPGKFMLTVYSLTGLLFCCCHVYSNLKNRQITRLRFLVGVPVDRQKLMCRAWKRKLSSDADFSAMPKLKNGLQVCLSHPYVVVG